MALYAVEGYKVPSDLAADPYAAEKDSVADKLSAYYGSDDAKYSDYGGALSAESSEPYGTSFASSQLSGAATTVSTELRIKPKSSRPSFFGEVLERILEPGGGFVPQVPVTEGQVTNIHDYWHNYDIHKSLRPKLLPDEDFSRAQVLLYAFRISFAKVKKREIKAAKEQAIQQYYALKVQCAARQRFARTVRRRKEAEKERDEEEKRKYNAFKARLLEGIPFRMFEHKAFEQKDCIAYVDLKDPKFLVVKGPKIKKAVKFDLMFLFRVHQGWSSPVMKETPRDNRPPKDFLLSLEGKSCLDLVCVGSVEDAKYDREEFGMCFSRLQDEINSSASIYRDAHGNRVRVVGSVFQPLASVVLKGAKDNPVKLAGKNMASLYKIQHRFTKHKANIHKGAKERAQAQSPTTANAAGGNNSGGSGGGAGVAGRTGGARAATLAGAAALAAVGRGNDRQFEVESRPSTLSNLSMMTDEVEYAEDPSRWAKNNKKSGGMAERLAARADADALLAAPISAESAMQQQERNAEMARAAILARSRGGKSAASSGGGRGDDDESYDESGSGSEDEDSDEDDSEEDDEDESEVDSDEELDDQASYTEYTETREEADNELLVDSDGDE